MTKILPFVTDQEPEAVVEVKSDGRNPLRYLDPKSPHFFEDARALAGAIVEVQPGPEQHFDESARNLVACLNIWDPIASSAETQTRCLLGEAEADAAQQDGGDGGRL